MTLQTAIQILEQEILRLQETSTRKFSKDSSMAWKMDLRATAIRLVLAEVKKP